MLFAVTDATPEPPPRAQAQAGPSVPSQSPKQGVDGSVIALAVGDLARRLQLSAADVTVLEARNVLWPDRSLGCPRPGVAYPQVPQDGALIRLQAQGRTFNYHVGGIRPPFLCENAP